jgi:hypothetical protein
MVKVLESFPGVPPSLGSGMAGWPNMRRDALYVSWPTKPGVSGTLSGTTFTHPGTHAHVVSTNEAPKESSKAFWFFSLGSQADPKLMTCVQAHTGYRNQ